jgi:GNAT superfamily N-acetyltransferase
MEAIQVVEGLAREIWSEHFTPILGEARVAYMLDRIQSASAIAKQVRDGGYEYYLVADRGEAIGYFAIIHDRQSASMQLSKLYVKRSHRGRGLGRPIHALRAASESFGSRSTRTTPARSASTEARASPSPGRS